MKPMAPWSKIKVNESPACKHTIWDYFGLLCIKQDKQIKKVWVCIFTCITVRAIHFELVEHYIRTILAGAEKICRTSGIPKKNIR